MLHIASLITSSPSPAWSDSSVTHLKRAPKSKGKGSLQVPLLCAPALTHFVVTHQHLFAPLTEAGVDVKGNVVASQKVHCEPVEDQSWLGF